MPQQSVFLDKSTPQFAPFVYVSELIDDHLIVRLMGTGLVERWGRDKTGEDILQGQPTEAAEAITSNNGTAIAHPCGYTSNIEYSSTTGRHIVVKVVSLPLSVGSDKRSRIVSYADLIQKFGQKEVASKILGVPKSEWVDIGAGVPTLPPK